MHVPEQDLAELRRRIRATRRPGRRTVHDQSQRVQSATRAGGATAATLGAWLVFENEAAVSMAALVCFKSGERSRVIHRPGVQGRHRGAHRGFTSQDHRDLLVRAHLQLGGPIVVVWDHLNVHRRGR
ncbi:hypothetical protein [Streptomyces sp. NPDC086777]|uniref:hypothetical protein n=1 Tax=Streptomyces sp. NPDC086777 TaxID=3154866 RepID=UPI00344F3E6C